MPHPVDFLLSTGWDSTTPNSPWKVARSGTKAGAPSMARSCFCAMGGKAQPLARPKAFPDQPQKRVGNHILAQAPFQSSHKSGCPGPSSAAAKGPGKAQPSTHKCERSTSLYAATGSSAGRSCTSRHVTLSTAPCCLARSISAWQASASVEHERISAAIVLASA